MKLKDNVKLQGITPELLIGILIAERIFDKYKYELIITSAVDSKHSATSLHYAGNAADFRIRHISDKSIITQIVQEIKSSLTQDFDIILEPDHIHLEHQPRF